MSRYRDHRGGYAESMATMRIVTSLEELKDYFRSDPMIPRHLVDDVKVKRYGDGRDPRNDWDTHLVYIKGYGVLGFLDGPL
jgi:hypothetical protein